MRYNTSETSLYAGIGERILLARRRAGLSQRALSLRLGVTHVSISHLERGETRADLDNLAAVADALNVPLSDIVVLERRRPRTVEGKADVE